MKSSCDLIMEYCLMTGPEDVLCFLPKGLNTQAEGSMLDFFIRSNLKIEGLMSENKKELQKFASLIPVFHKARQTFFLTFAALGQPKTGCSETQDFLVGQWQSVPETLEKMALVFTHAANGFDMNANHERAHNCRKICGGLKEKASDLRFLVLPEAVPLDTPVRFLKGSPKKTRNTHKTPVL